MNLRRPAAVVGWAAALASAIVTLHWAGRGALGGPPVTEPGQWAGWLEGREPVLAAFGLLRVVAQGGLWYLVAVTVVGAALRVAGAASLVRLTDRLTIGPVRRMLAGSVSLGLAASGVLVGPVTAQTSTTTTTAVPPATVTMHRLDPAEPAAVTPATQVTPTAPQVATDRWTVKPGECFWSIAESVLSARWGRPPTDAEIVPYWQRLIEANRHELVHRDNPDLIFPAQVFVLPSP